MIQRCIIIGILIITAILAACQKISSDSEDLDVMEIESNRIASPLPLDQEQSEEAPQDIIQPLNPSFTVLGSVEYQIQQRLTLVNNGPGSPSKQNLWVALISDDYPYQEVSVREIKPIEYRLITDENGNQFAEFDFSNMLPDSEIQVLINYKVKVNQLEYDLSTCQGDLPGFYTSPELHIESQNPQITSLSKQLSQGKLTACDQVRSFYDFVGDELVYTYNGGNWGAQAALGQMGADCTEYSSLMIALSRAAGIPARYIEGLNIAPQGEQELARREHAWLEVYLPGIGWTPMDPTLGRSSITREKYFAELPPDHVIVSRGRNPSTLRGSSYWTYLYWPGNSAEIKIEGGDWVISPLQD